MLFKIFLICTLLIFCITLYRIWYLDYLIKLELLEELKNQYAVMNEIVENTHCIKHNTER